jgi:flagellar biosynthesis/type III secretory pathway protein FliH
MDFNTIKIKISQEVYNVQYPYPRESKLLDGYVFDENKTVKENRLMVEKYNEDIDTKKRAYSKEEDRLSKQFENDVVEAIVSEGEFSKEAAQAIYNRAYEEGHSAGYEEVVNIADDLMQFVQEVILKNK